MKRNKRIAYILLAWCIGLCMGCQEDISQSSEGEQETWQVTVSPQEPHFESYARYHTLTLAASDPTDSLLLLRSEADWLILTCDTLPTDGILECYVTNNPATKRREAEITVTSLVHEDRTATLTIVQYGLGDNNENDGDEDPLSDFRVGWGFNAFDEYKSLTSLRGKIIDTYKLDAYSSDTTFNGVQEVVRGKETFAYHAAYSLQEMASTLTKKMTNETKFLGVKKTTQRYSKIATQSSNELYYGYARLSKTVASRSIDEGVVRYMCKDNTRIKEGTLPFTPAFYTTYNNIRNHSGSERDTYIRQMLEEYGTHLIVDAAVGGMIDYVVSFDKKKTSKLEISVEEQSKYVFGRMKRNDMTQQTSQQMASSIRNEHTFQIKGGSESAKKKLKETIDKLESADQLTSQLLLEWASSIKSTSLNNPDERANLDVVDFSFIPIWSLFADSEITNRIQYWVIALSEQSNNAFSEKELGVDNYKIDLSDASFYNFNNKGTLVKVLYDKNTREPMIEICNEYVPKIRTDRRITVFYPVIGGKTNIGQGIFPGDGEGNGPAHLSFSGSDAYVQPIEGYGYNDKLTSLYYLHGNLYDKDYNIACKAFPPYQVKDYYLSLEDVYYEGNYSELGIVKIGSGYWTRDIPQNVGIGARSSHNQEYVDSPDGFLHIPFSTNYVGIVEKHPDLINIEENEYGYRTCWFIPKSTDYTQMIAYLSNNIKSIFLGQVSGFDLIFYSYYRLDKRWYYYEKQDENVAYLATYDQVFDKVLSVTEDINWSFKNNFDDYDVFPIRLFRTSYYQYPKLE